MSDLYLMKKVIILKKTQVTMKAFVPPVVANAGIAKTK